MVNFEGLRSAFGGLLPNHPDDRTVARDLDPNSDGDLVVTVSVPRTQALVISGNSVDSNAWSASVKWVDSDDNVYQSETATDVELSSVTDDWARLVRKGPRATVTFTSEVTGGTQNRVNAYIGTHW